MLACLRLHTSASRMARWLLMLRDRWTGDALPVTDEALAKLLDVDTRDLDESLSLLVAANVVVRPDSGLVRIVNREGLEHAVCSCYWYIRDNIERAVQP